MDYIFVCRSNRKLEERNIPYSQKIYTSVHEYIESSAYSDNKKFFAKSDLWGINTHYWFKNDNVFMCSNSINSILSELQSIELSRERIYDVLFLGFPYEGSTVYENVQRLKADESLSFDCKEFRVKIDKINRLNELLEFEEEELDVAKLQKILDNNFACSSSRVPYITLSAGSDTRTILATLFHYNMLPEAVVFGDDESLELYYVEKLCRKYGIAIHKIDSRIYPNDYIKELERYLKLGNHLVNGQNIHLARIFDNRIDDNRDIYAGFMGSQFIKGQFSELMIGIPCRELLIGNQIKDIVSKHFYYLTENIKREFKDYLGDKLSKELLRGNDTNQDIINYLFYNIPSSVFAGPILSGQNQGYKIVLPFISPDILSYAYKTGYGIRDNISVMDDYDWRRQFLFQAHWCELMSNELYNSFIPQYGGSLRNLSKLPPKLCGRICGARKSIYSLWGRYILKRPFSGQIERQYQTPVKREYISNNIGKSIIGEYVDKGAVYKMDRATLDTIIYLLISDFQRIS